MYTYTVLNTALFWKASGSNFFLPLVCYAQIHKTEAYPFTFKKAEGIFSHITEPMENFFKNQFIFTRLNTIEENQSPGLGNTVASNYSETVGTYAKCFT